MIRYQFLRFPEGKTKALTFSYDDGCIEDPRLSDIFSEHGLKGTFNLTGSIIRGKNALPKEVVVSKFLDRGHEIAVHGLFHRAEGNVRPIEGIRDVLDCRLELEERYEMIIRGMAYPDSGIRQFTNVSGYETVRNYLSELDIAYARTLGADNDSFDLPTDWLCWMPTCHHDQPKIFEWAEKFLELDVNAQYGSARQPRLFFIWGHAFELRMKDNWDHMERICDTFAGRADIWYATNIEIHDYVEAYRSLRYSADGRRIYNPTLMTVWFDVDKTLYSIAPGETIVIDK